MVGGEIKDYTKMLNESRNIAIERLRTNAAAMGADAVVMMRFDSGSIGTDMQSVAAYGTAVKYKWLPHIQGCVTIECSLRFNII